MPFEITPFEATLDFARRLDAADELKSLRSRFYIPQHQDTDCVYLTGNSLGLQPRTTRDFVLEELDAWRDRAGDAHLVGPHPWLPYHELLTEGLSLLVGAKKTEVVAMNSLTVNLHLLMTSFYRPTSQRNRIILEAGAFPSDLYAAESQGKIHGFNDVIGYFSPRLGEDVLRTSDILEKLDRERSSTSLVLLGHPNYRTGQAYDIAAIASTCRSLGIVLGLDLAHGIGNLQLKLHDWNVDFGVWCSYKYLNAGPGAIGGCYVHERHHRTELPRLCGWWGHDKATRFEMPQTFVPIPTVEAWQISNPPIFQAAALRASLDIFDTAGGMAALVQKSWLLTGFMEFLFRRSTLHQVTPPADRGCQVSFRHPGARELTERLRLSGIVADYRHPDIIRVAAAPLYNTFEDVWRFSQGLGQYLDKTLK